MAISISDEEIRSRLSNFLGASSVPPVIDTTRAILMAKLSKLEKDETSSSSHSLDEGNPQLKDKIMATKSRFESLDSVGARKLAKSKFATLVFFDLEATGLPGNPSPPRITELAMKAINIDHFLDLEQILQIYASAEGVHSIVPRVVNSLTLTFNPCTLISDTVADLTGLNNDLLEHQHRFSDATAQLLQAFLSHLPQPVCLVAHNGNRYDFPLLKSELHFAECDLDLDSIFTIDSLSAMRKLYDEGTEKALEELLMFESFDDDFEMNEEGDKKVPSKISDSSQRKEGAKKQRLNFDQPSSFSLPKLFLHIYGAKPTSSHGADEDVLTLVRVCASRSAAFVNYMEANHLSLKEIKQMW